MHILQKKKNGNLNKKKKPKEKEYNTPEKSVTLKCNYVLYRDASFKLNHYCFL